MDPAAGIELGISRLGQHRQAVVQCVRFRHVYDIRFIPPKLCQNTFPMAWPRMYWTTDNPSEMHMCEFQQLCPFILNCALRK